MNQQWIPRMQQCELRLYEMEQQIKDLRLTRRYLHTEANQTLDHLSDCAEELCRINRELNAALSRPVPQAIPLIRAIAQDLDQQCINYEREAGTGQWTRDSRGGVIRAYIDAAREREERGRRSRAPGGE